MTVATLVTVAMVGAIGVGVVVVGTQDAAAEHDSPGNYTVVLPDDSDHLPGDQNPEGASIQHFAAMGDLFEETPDPDGFEEISYLEITSEDVDFSACGSSNTAVFGIDRGYNNSGTQIDTDLLQHMSSSSFESNGIFIEFYEPEDFGGDPTHINPEDAIVAVQGDGSAGGECYTMPEEPGWYQMDGLMRGVGYNGEEFEVDLESHYFPICEGCHDEETARDELGPAPSDDEPASETEETPTPEGDDTTPTPEPKAEETPTPEPQADDTTPEPEGDDTTPTPEPETETPTPEPAPAGGGDGQQAQSDDEPLTTPTVGDGPGFGVVGALVALLAGTLLVRRRT